MRVLLAEGDAGLRRMLQRALWEMGHEPCPAWDAATMLWRGRDAALDAVLCGASLPDGDAIALCGLLRDERPHLRFVILAGDGESARRAGQQRFPAVLRLPFRLSELELALASARLHPAGEGS